MLYGGVNILGIYSTKSNRSWDNTKNQFDYIVMLNRGLIPMIQLMVDAATSATITVFDEQTQGLGVSDSMVVENMTTYVRLTYAGIQGQFPNNGYYSFVITTNTETFYTDVFYWGDNLSDYLKIKVKSSNIALNPNMMAVQVYEGIATGLSGGYIYELYLKATKNKVTPDTQEKAEESDGITEINYGVTSFIYSYDIQTNESLMKFINYLRMLSVNGTIELTWRGEVIDAKDIEIEEKEVHNGCDLYDLTLKCKNAWETMMVINTII